ncbi:MAG: hypothetical protein IM577_11040 [Chitinophagaceae bacterium]|jgi:hypothetical protein|nr:hypothetical protein [Chitinophagaceae bacterium]MCA6516114.1 hypothetical protein [Chitinophagaceae bacterium]
MRDKLTQQKPKNEEADVTKKEEKTYQPTEKEIDEQLDIFADIIVSALLKKMDENDGL